MALDIVGSNPNRVHVENSAPILRVENMKTSLHFYGKLLGFTCADWGNDEFTCVSRDSAAIYLCQGGQGQGGAWVWIGVEDAAKLHQECKASGLKIKMAPTNYPWALEFHVQDPDWQRSPLRLRAPCQTTDALVEKPAVTDRMYSTLTI